jgi:hypothetical protein
MTSHLAGELVPFLLNLALTPSHLIQKGPCLPLLLQFLFALSECPSLITQLRGRGTTIFIVNSDPRLEG